jgi:hypothetical protein
MMQLPASVMANTFPFDGVAAEAGAVFAGGVQYGGGFGGGLTGNGWAARPVGVPVRGVGPTPGGDDRVYGPAGLGDGAVCFGTAGGSTAGDGHPTDGNLYTFDAPNV